mgnify:CR=1 FL=1
MVSARSASLNSPSITHLASSPSHSVPTNFPDEFNVLGAKNTAYRTLLGNIAVRTGKAPQWNPIDMKITNDYDANQYLREPCREGWDLVS